VPDFDSDQADRLRTEPPGSVPPAGEGLAVRGLTKTFGSTIALDHMDAAFARGTVHGLIGENGSGKSTFVKVVAGAHRADLGQVTLDAPRWRPAAGEWPRSREDAGGLRLPRRLLIGELTVGQNLDLIVDPESRVGKSWRRALLDDFGLTEVDLGSRVADIPNNEQRLVEIAAALARRPDVALFDESTAALDERGVARVLDSMRSAATAGVCVIFVTHRLHEVLAVAADITVLRDGRVVGELATSGASTDELVRLMAGREVAAFTRRNCPRRPPPGRSCRPLTCGAWPGSGGGHSQAGRDRRHRRRGGQRPGRADPRAVRGRRHRRRGAGQRHPAAPAGAGRRPRGRLRER